MSRRFAEVFEFDRNGPPLEGTPEQQAAIRETLAALAPYASPLHSVLRELDTAVNRKGRHFIPIGFADYQAANLHLLGFTWPTYIQLGSALLPEFVGTWFLHELGHLVAFHLLNPVDLSEDWANDFRDWALDGQPAGSITDRLGV